VSAIFLSHSSSDRDITSLVSAWLQEQGYRSVFLDFDPEQGIPGGRDWEKELYAQLRTCRAVIVLCSERFVASPWCFAEITHARALGKALFPVKVGECEIHPLLKTAQVIDFTADRETALTRLARGLKAAGLDPADSFDWDGTRPPYPGLLNFEEEDAGIFFGREKEIHEGLDTLEQQRRFGGARFMLLLGASGSGKSSLLRAGIVPRLRRNPDQWIVVRPFRPLGRPFENLAYVIADSFQEAGRSRDWKSLSDTMGAARAGAALAELANELRLDMKRPNATVLLVIDQLEELFALTGTEDTQRFLETLRAAAESNASPVLIVATLRSDFLGELQKYTASGDIAERLVNPMSLLTIGQIVEGPAVVANLELSPGLVPAMLQDTQAENALPLLAFTLREMWERRQGNKLTLEAYRDELGGLSGSVARAAEGVWTGAKALSAQEEAHLRRAFLALVRVNDEGRFTRQPARWTDLPESIHPLLERFVRARLLVSRHDAGGRVLEVAHEALFRSWRRLAKWLDEDRAFLLWRKRVDQALEFWVSGGKRTQSLLVTDLLHESQSQLKDRGEQLNNNERAFIDASITADRRARKRVVLGISAFIVAVMLAGAVALWEYVVADRQRQLAVARQLAAEAQSFFDSGGGKGVQRSLFMATASLHAAWTEEGLNAWARAIKLAPPLPTILDADRGPYTSVTFSADGKLMAAAGKKAILVFDGKSFKEMFELPAPHARRLALSPDGQFLAAGVARSLVVWDLGTKRQVQAIPTGLRDVTSIAFDLRGSRLAFTDSLSVQVFDTRGWKELTQKWMPEWPAPDGKGRSGGNTFTVAFSPDSRWLLSTVSTSSLVVWDLARFVTSPTRGTGPTFSVAFHGPEFDSTFFLSFTTGGQWLALSTGLWSVAPAPNGVGISSIPRRGVPTRIFAINGDASLTAAFADRGIAIWQTPNVSDPPPRELARIVYEVRGVNMTNEEPVAFSPVGGWLITGGERLERWDVSAGAESHQLPHESEVLAVASSRDGRHIGTATADGFVHIWNTTDWRRVKSLDIRERREDETASRVAFSGDNRWVAATSGKMLKVFSTDGWSEVARKEYDHALSGIAFSPDARWMIAAGNRADSNSIDVLEVGSWRAVPGITHKRVETRPIGSTEAPNCRSTSVTCTGSPIYSVSVNPGGDQLLTMTIPYCEGGESFPGVAHVWRITSGERLASVPLSFKCVGVGESLPMSGHASFKEWAHWTTLSLRSIYTAGKTLGETSDELTTRDGRRATSEEADRIYPWVLAEQRGVKDIALAQEGRWLVTTGSGGNARVWALTRPDIIAESCSRLRRVGYGGQDSSGVEFTSREPLLRDACPEMRTISYIRR